MCILKHSEPDHFRNTDAITAIDCLLLSPFVWLVIRLLAELSALWCLWRVVCVCKGMEGWWVVGVG